ncbi:elongation of fatty acids protein 3-like, partial [Phtheirospermum japonicum]
ITSRSTLPSSAFGGTTPNHGAPRGPSSSPPSPSTSPPPPSSTPSSSSSSATAAPPLGPLPAAHSLLMALLSATIFAGTVLSAAAEIRDTRWLWRRSRTTPFQWLLCFPSARGPSGRVFFWSYAYYLSRFPHALRSFIAILRYRKLSFFKLFNHSISIFMSFLWLEFSQSFQVLAILLTTLVYSVVYGYRFWTAIGLPSACFPFVVNCQMVLLSCNLVCHFGVLLMHFIKGGCNGIGAWLLNSVLNGAILFLILNFYVKMRRRKIKAAGDACSLVGAKVELVKDKDI